MTTLALLAIFAISPHGSAGSAAYLGAMKGSEAVQQLANFRQEYFKTHPHPTAAEYYAAVQKKAEDLLGSIDEKNAPVEEATDWAQVMDAAKHYQNGYDLLEKYIATNPGQAQTFDAQASEISELAQLGDMDKASALASAMQPSGDAQATKLGQVYEMSASMLEEKQGADAALKFLDGGFARFKSLPTKGVEPLYDMKLNLLDELGRTADEKATLAELAARYPDGKLPAAFADTATRLALVGQPAPAVDAESKMYGSYKGLDSLKGKVVVLDFFAHWCPPCKASMPDMRKLSDALGDKVQVVGITRYYGFFDDKKNLTKDQEFDLMKPFMAKYGIDHPVVYNDKAAFEAYGVSGIPEFVLIGKDGAVKKILLGYGPDEFKGFRTAVEQATKE